MNFRTDLALECCEKIKEKELQGIDTEIYETGKAKVTRIVVKDKEGENLIGKPRGTYITVEAEPFTHYSSLEESGFEAIKTEIEKILPTGDILVAGLGNAKITPDALGPRCVSMIFATRHIKGEFAEVAGFENLRSVSAFATDVLGNTGAESSEIIKGVAGVIKPAAIVTVDALAAGNVSRLGRTVQISTQGIIPGSGVGNARKEVSERTVGVPVIAVGVPTVVDAATLASDYMGVESGNRDIGSMMVTPKEIDLMIERSAKLIALALNCAFQPEITPEDMVLLTS